MRKYTLDEIYIGMEVNPDQLSEIYDTYILVTKNHLDDETGIIEFIGKEQNDKYKEIFFSGKVIAPIYNDSFFENIEFIG